VAGEKNGVWGKAKEVPGTAALNAGGSAGVFSVSCASAGNCSAGGQYQDASGRMQAFVAGEENGIWGTAVGVPGLAALNVGGNAEVTSVSCASAGDCGAGGRYEVDGGQTEAFVAEETNGTWGAATEVPGTAVLNAGGAAKVASVSCRSAGACSAGGQYQDGSRRTQAFVVGEENGVWGTAIQVPGLAALNAGGFAQISQVSCGSAGNCGAGGQYKEGSGDPQAFVVAETSGIWGTAMQVPGLAALDSAGGADLSSVSCVSAGHCSVGGYYGDGSGKTQAFVAGQTNGAWGKAIEVPGTAALNVGGGAEITSLACTAGGHCSAGGIYTDSAGNAQSFVVSR
jgi:hypothetical protein